MASGSIPEHFGIGPRPSSRRIRLTESIREDTGLSPRDLLSTIITTASDNSKLKSVLVGHLFHYANSTVWEVRLLEELARLVHHTRDNHQWTEMLLAWAVDQRGNAFKLTHEDVRRAIEYLHFRRGADIPRVEAEQNMLRDVHPTLYTMVYEMTHDQRRLPELSRQEEDAEESEDDFEVYRGRRVHQYLTEAIASSRHSETEATVANHLPTPLTPPSSAPSTPPYAPATAPSTPTKKRGRPSDDNESETNSNGHKHGKDGESANKRRRVG